MSTVTFTPFVCEGTRLRACLEISSQDLQKFNSLPKESEAAVEVFDELSQNMYRVKRADCGRGCRCAAVLVLEMEVN